MKRESRFFILVIFLLLSLNHTCWSQLYKPSTIEVVDMDPNLNLKLYNPLDSVEWRINNSISECTISLHQFKKGEINDKVIKYVTYKFNSSGIITEMIYDKGRKLLTNELNDKNQIIRSIITKLPKGDTLTIKSIDYKSNGRIEKIIENDKNDNKWNATNFTYNDNGDISQIMVYGANEKHPDGNYEAYRERYKYDNEGKLIELQKCQRLMTGSNITTLKELAPKTFTEGQCSYKVINTYNNTGILIKSDYYSPDLVPLAGFVKNDKPAGYLMWILNDNNQITGYLNYNSMNKLISKTIYTLDEKGNTTQIMNYNDYGLESKIIQGWNQDNSLSLKMKYGSENNIIYMYGYEYDDKGVKIQIIEYSIETRQPDKVYLVKYQ
jgi:hypothetical protein